MLPPPRKLSLVKVRMLGPSNKIPLSLLTSNIKYSSDVKSMSQFQVQDPLTPDNPVWCFVSMFGSATLAIMISVKCGQ